MKINFTNKEYRQLIDLVFLGDWMVSAFEEGNVKSPYDAIRNKIYSHAKEFGLKDFFEHNQPDDQYYETAQFEDELMHYVDEYNKNVMLHKDR